MWVSYPDPMHSSSQNQRREKHFWWGLQNSRKKPSGPLYSVVVCAMWLKEPSGGMLGNILIKGTWGSERCPWSLPSVLSHLFLTQLLDICQKEETPSFPLCLTYHLGIRQWLLYNIKIFYIWRHLVYQSNYSLFKRVIWTVSPISLVIFVTIC